MSKVRLVLLGLFAVLAASAVAAATASAVMPAYTDSAGNLISGTLQVLSLSTAKPTLKGTLSGVKIEIQCEKEHGTGSIQNSATTGTGLGLAFLHYSKCTFVKVPGKGCVIENELVITNQVHSNLLLSAIAGRYLVDFAPDPSTIFALIKVKSCEVVGLNQDFPVEGTAMALANNTNLTLEFSSTTGSNLKFGGSEATYTDVVTVEMLGGGGIMIENGV